MGFENKNISTGSIQIVRQKLWWVNLLRGYVEISLRINSYKKRRDHRSSSPETIPASQFLQNWQNSVIWLWTHSRKQKSLLKCKHKNILVKHKKINGRGISLNKYSRLETLGSLINWANHLWKIRKYWGQFPWCF